MPTVEQFRSECSHVLASGKQEYNYRLPRYLDIRRAIEARIMSGTLKPGDRIPGELELVDEFGVSRMTVNKALSSLVTTGLLERRRGSGSFVASPKSQHSVLEIHDIKFEVESAGHAYRHALLSRKQRLATADDRTRLPVNARTKVLALVVRHFAGRRPFVLEDRLINLSVVPEAASAPFDDIAPGTWLLQRIPWTEAEHTIRAVAASAETASLLDIRTRSACLVVERATWRSGAPVTSVRLTYPGDRHQLAARFSPASTKRVR
jgi:GntR family histidine utilization transcriptional repressor